jgi:hypothetical protein
MQQAIQISLAHCHKLEVCYRFLYLGAFEERLWKATINIVIFFFLSACNRLINIWPIFLKFNI